MYQLIVSGGPVMYPLFACSLLVLFVIIERGLFWAGIRYHRDPGLLDEILDLCRRGEWEEVREKVHGNSDFIIRILVTGIVHRDFSLAMAMEAAAAEQIRRMSRFMSLLDTMITVAPLLGIFGTVIGIIISFDMLGAAGLNDPRAVTGGIAQALITTAAGLSIAIFSLFPYNYFNSLIRKAAHEIEQYATSLEIVHEKLQIRREKKP